FVLLCRFSVSSDLDFFSVVRRAPTSTLFPYTTLFRSDQRAEPRSELLAARRRLQPHAARSERRHGPHGLHRHAHPVRQLHDGQRDRKSTRLNSSHVKISYAVFCLKKKNNGARDRRRLY